MEGYIYKKDNHFPAMLRRYAVLDGTLMSFYPSKEDYEKRTKPLNIYEIIHITDWNGKTALKLYENGFEIISLQQNKYQCSTKDPEEKNIWMRVIKESLDKPNEILNDELRTHLQSYKSQTLKKEEKIEMAKKSLQYIKKLKEEMNELENEIQKYKKKKGDIKRSIEELNNENIKISRQCKDIESSSVSVSASTSSRIFDEQEENTEDNETEDENKEHDMQSGRTRKKYEENEKRLEQYKKEFKNLIHNIEAKTKELKVKKEQDKQERITASITLREIRMEFGDKDSGEILDSECLQEVPDKESDSARSTESAASFYLHCLAEGYLLYKLSSNRIIEGLKRPNRKYFVLFGKTLSLYDTMDRYHNKPDVPFQVYHITGVSSWKTSHDTKKGFQIRTLQDKIIYCIPDIKSDMDRWIMALHMGCTLPAMSPRRALQAQEHKKSVEKQFEEISKEDRCNSMTSVLDWNLNEASVDSRGTYSCPDIASALQEVEQREEECENKRTKFRDKSKSDIAWTKDLIQVEEEDDDVEDGNSETGERKQKDSNREQKNGNSSSMRRLSFQRQRTIDHTIDEIPLSVPQTRALSDLPAINVEKIRYEGCITMRSGLIPIKNERYCVLNDLDFSIWKTKEDSILGKDYDPAREEFVSVEEYKRISNQDETPSPLGQYRLTGIENIENSGTDFKLQTQEKGIIECSVETNEKVKWITAVSKSLLRNSENENELVSEHHLQKTKGVNFDGPLRLKATGGTGLQLNNSRSRYCILKGTRFYVYLSDDQAYSKFPEEADEIYDIDEVTDIEIRQFRIKVKSIKEHEQKTIVCIANTGKEKLLWINAIAIALENLKYAEKEKEMEIEESTKKGKAVSIAQNKYNTLYEERDRKLKEFERAIQMANGENVDEDAGTETETAKLRKRSVKSADMTTETEHLSGYEVGYDDDDASDTETNSGFLACLLKCCTCSSYRNNQKSLQEPLLSEKERKLYYCEFYEAGK